MTKDELRDLLDRIKAPYLHNGSEMSKEAANARRESDVRRLAVFLGERLLREMETGCPMAKVCGDKRLVLAIRPEGEGGWLYLERAEDIVDYLIEGEPTSSDPDTPSELRFSA